MWKWVDWLAVPVWWLVPIWLTYQLLRLLVEEIARRHIVKPAIDQFDRALNAASRAARALLTALAPHRRPRHIAMRAEPGVYTALDHQPHAVYTALIGGIGIHHAQVTFLYRFTPACRPDST